MRQRPFQQGEPVTMTLVNKENNVPKNLNPGEIMVVGLYADNGKVILKSSDSSQIHRESQTGCYTVFVTSDMTKCFVGKVDVHICIYNSNSGQRIHANNIFPIYFEERPLNDEINEI